MNRLTDRPDSGDTPAAAARWRAPAAAMLALICAGLILGLVALLLAPVSDASASSTGPAAIAFRLDRQRVSLPGQCTTVRWEVSDIREVYLDTEDVIGQGTREVCPLWPEMHTLDVVLLDGTRQTYPLFLDVMFWTPACWLLLAGILLTGGTALRWSGRFSTPPILVHSAAWLRARSWATALWDAILVAWIMALMLLWVLSNSPRLAALNDVFKALSTLLRSIFHAPYRG